MVVVGIWVVRGKGERRGRRLVCFSEMGGQSGLKAFQGLGRHNLLTTDLRQFVSFWYGPRLCGFTGWLQGLTDPLPVQYISTETGTCISVWRHHKLSEQIHPQRTLYKRKVTYFETT